MILQFKPSDFNISGKPIPQNVADKILNYHILPIQDVADCFTEEIFVSKKSGYRSWSWELAHKRSGTSQHCFGEKQDGSFDPLGLGAVDWTCEDFKIMRGAFLSKLIEYTDYTRFCLYNGFIHCDYKPTPNGDRQLFEYSEGKWEFIKNV